MSMGGAMGATITNYKISIETDEVGRVRTFKDGGPASNPSLADIWNYLKIKNVQTGKTWDLRLHTSVLKASVDMAKQALAEGADVNLRIKQGSTALHWAAAKGREEIVQLLIDHGADVNAVDELGWTPAFLASNSGFGAIAQLLVKCGAKTRAMVNGREAELFTPGQEPNDQLIEAVEAGDLEAARTAIGVGADVNCVSGDGWAPLLSAVKQDPRLTELLLANGADPNVASDRGYTPLMRAAGLGKLEVVRLLLAAGADKQMRDCDGKTASQLALEMRQFQCAEMLKATSVQEQQDTVAVAFDDGERKLLGECGEALGTAIKEVDVTFTDGSLLNNVPVGNGSMLIPKGYAEKSIKWISIPIEQGVQVRNKGYAARSDRSKNSIELGTTMMNWMMQQLKDSQE